MRTISYMNHPKYWMRQRIRMNMMKIKVGELFRLIRILIWLKNFTVIFGDGLMCMRVGEKPADIFLGVNHGGIIQIARAVIDRKLVWYGGMNLLGKADVYDNLIRVENEQAAAELLKMTEGLC